MPNTDINPDDLTIDGEESYTEWLQEMADVIRDKLDTDEQMKPVAFPSKMRGIPNNTGQLLKVSNNISSTQNLTYELSGIPQSFWNTYAPLISSMANAAGVNVIHGSLFLTGDAIEVGDWGFCWSSTNANSPLIMPNFTDISFRYCQKVGAKAFGGGMYLRTCSFPELMEIGESAFWGNSKMTTFYAPKCSSIGSYAFGAKSGISKPAFSQATLGSPEDIGMYAFQYQSALQSGISLENAKSIGNGAFYGCFKLSMPADAPLCTFIDSRAFQSCSSVPYAYLPNLSSSAKLSSAFQDATALSFAYISYADRGGNRIDSAFLSCSNLEAVVFRNLGGFGNSVFIGASKLQSIYLWNDTSTDYTVLSNYTGIPASCKMIVPDFAYDGYLGMSYYTSSKLMSLPEAEFKRQVKELVDEVRGVDTPIWGDDSDDEATA